MYRLYVTDTKSLIDKVSELFKCKYEGDNLYSFEGNLILLINATFVININGEKGRWVLKLKDAMGELDFKIDYISWNDIKTVKEVIEKYKQEHIEIINFCQSSAQGQLNFDIFIRQINIDTRDISRIWLRETNINKNTLIKTSNNFDFKSISDTLLTERLIDALWKYKKNEMFEAGEYINLKEMIVLSLLNEREKQIIEKESELQGSKDYFRIELNSENIKFKWFNSNDKIDRIFDADSARELVTSMRNKKLLITNIVRNIKRKPHPLLYNTTDLVNEAQKAKLGNMNQINTAILNLFKNGHISNPNTESRHLPNEFTSRSYLILSALKTLSKYRVYIEYIKTKGKIEITDRIINTNLVDKNHAIIPTENMPKQGELNQIENDIYDLIVRRFLSAFMGDTVIKSIKINGYIDDTNHAKYEDTQVVEYGWNLLYRDNDNEYLDIALVDTPQKKELNIDDIKVIAGNKYSITSITMPVSNQKSKLRYTVSNVLKLLDTCGKNIKNEDKMVRSRHLGIGTIEERSTILNEMINDELVIIDEDGRLILSSLGEDILKKVPEELSSLNYLKALIKKIKAVQHGIETTRTVVNDHLLTMNRVFLERETKKRREEMCINYSSIINKKLCYCFSKLKEEDDYIVCTNSNCGLKIPKVKCGYILREHDILNLINFGITDLIDSFIFKGGTITDGKGKLYRTDKGNVLIDFGNNKKTGGK